MTRVFDVEETALGRRPRRPSAADKLLTAAALRRQRERCNVRLNLMVTPEVATLFTAMAHDCDLEFDELLEEALIALREKREGVERGAP